jgi:hypothetical protein
MTNEKAELPTHISVRINIAIWVENGQHVEIIHVQDACYILVDIVLRQQLIRNKN